MLEVVASELLPQEFNSRLLPLFEVMWAGRKRSEVFNPDYFFPKWRALMEAGIARAWETNRAILGAVFIPNCFSGCKIGNVSFWFAMPEVRGMGVSGPLMQAFEKAAIEEKCVAIYAATPMSEFLAKAYLKNGYSPDETQFKKILDYGY